MARTGSRTLDFDSTVDLGKRLYVKDPLWNSILLFPWEKILIEHPVFTRLNSVLQNSSGFRVYPGLKVPRFIHSLGVMHVATKIFQSITCDCDPGLGDMPDHKGQAFLKEATHLRNLGDFSDKEILLVFKRVKRDTPLPFTGTRVAEAELGLLLTAVRIGALVHDIGHLPYSHVAEHALEALYNSKDRILPVRYAQNEAAFREAMSDLLGTKHSEKTKPHEKLGEKLLPFLQVIFREKQNDFSKLLVKLIGLSKMILHSDKFPIAQSILKGTTDADRIDFVHRDTHFSGLLTSSVDYDRLFSFFCLQTTRFEGRDVIVAAPSPRALSEVKKLLWERFQDYKFIVCHHRVHFFDELVQRCIFELAKAGFLVGYLDRITRLNSELNSELPSVLDSIFKRIDLITSLDDPWLEMQIREVFVEAITQINGQQYSRSQKKFTPWLKDLLTAYVSDRGLFRSAFKNDDVFWEFCREKNATLLVEINQIKEIKRKSDRLKGIAKEVNTHKYSWERALREKPGGLSVIIGDVSSKLNIGISGPDAASMLGLKGLSEFLENEVMNTMPFNFWIKSTDQADFITKRDAIFSEIIGRLDKQLPLGM